MIKALPVAEFLSAGLPVIDVRSPGEYARGHIPAAVNVPLFEDAERAVVGTLYKRAGRDAAVLEGLRITGPKLAGIVEHVRIIAPEGRVAVHCWRGGERSSSIAWLLGKAGFEFVVTLTGGYKAFRNLVLREVGHPRPMNILGGYTGSGKTETLSHLRSLGEQVIDLEAMADHKGSSYGALGEAPQPTTEQFENLLWHSLLKSDPGRAIWVEDESPMIGRVKIPDAFFALMRSAPLFFVEVPIEDRALRLVQDYGRFPIDQLAEATKRIGKRIGPQHCKTALHALETGDLLTVAMIALQYYDRTYAHGASKRDPAKVVRIPGSGTDLRSLAKRLQVHATAPVTDR